jgi:sortase A
MLRRYVTLGIAFLLIACALVVRDAPLGTLIHSRTQAAAVSLAPESLTNRLVIPSIGVNAKIESLGLTPDGAMDTPAGPNDVGWYSLGARPGEMGTAVIGGHRGWKNDVPAVFDDLDKVKKGDTITVTDGSDKTYFFIVRETRVYDKSAIAPEVFTSSEGAHLNLITCVGTWDDELKSSQERFVVFADLVP